jgi:hypothetical protein
MRQYAKKMVRVCLNPIIITVKSAILNYSLREEHKLNLSAIGKGIKSCGYLVSPCDIGSTWCTVPGSLDKKGEEDSI